MVLKELCVTIVSNCFIKRIKNKMFDDIDTKE